MNVFISTSSSRRGKQARYLSLLRLVIVVVVIVGSSDYYSCLAVLIHIDIVFPYFLSNRYMKYLYPYECEKEKYSSPNELQAAIDGNRREGRRSSYGAYADLVPRGGGGGGGGSNGGGGNGSVSGAAQHAASLSALASHMSHMSPLSLVSRPSALNGNGHHRPGKHRLALSSPLSHIQLDRLIPSSKRRRRRRPKKKY